MRPLPPAPPLAPPRPDPRPPPPPPPAALERAPEPQPQRGQGRGPAAGAEPAAQPRPRPRRLGDRPRALPRGSARLGSFCRRRDKQAPRLPSSAEPCAPSQTPGPTYRACAVPARAGSSQPETPTFRIRRRCDGRGARATSKLYPEARSEGERCPRPKRDRKGLCPMPPSLSALLELWFYLVLACVALRGRAPTGFCLKLCKRNKTKLSSVRTLIGG
ncbi:formin-like protein 5 [Theropithecus gelada]|uniref:formin-like protein 5 n=1 Tax=Theropithecus gelada TaxID=9565 RepID=UPI000DC1716A|nr:formin-like protein 5 [Theropithecus gelada]